MRKWFCMYGFGEDVQFMVLEADTEQQAKERFCIKSDLDYKEGASDRVFVDLLEHLHPNQMFYYDLD